VPVTPELAKGAKGLRPPRWRRLKWLAVLAAFGPGLMVMFADTDAGSVVTAAQSGARWGYALLPLQLLLIPVLYLVMELTVRLGIATKKGHAQLIKERFGRGWAGISVGALLISTTGALTTEFAGLAGVGSMVGLSPDVVIPAGAAFLGLVVMSGSYRRVERIGVALGLFELAFIVAAVRAHPGLSGIAGSIWAREPLGNSGYLSLVAANVGAVVMPWMIFYQQAAVVDKGLGPKDLKAERVDTAVGAVLTQMVMIAVLVATGTTLFRHHSGSLDSVPAISSALVPYLGEAGAKLAFALGMAGAALVAGIVVSLAAAWAFAELTGAPASLNRRARQEPLFYGAYFFSLLVAGVLVLVSASLVRLAVAVEVGNALLLPIVLGFLLALAWKALPEPYRLSRLQSAVTLVVIVAVVALALALGAGALGL
jgi:Mn2+/Fe2+ NRAMP family transporter